MLRAISEDIEEGIWVLRDFHPFLNDHVVVRQLREVGFEIQRSRKTIILISPTLILPPELEQEVTVLKFDPPSFSELSSIIETIIDSARRNGEINIQLDQEEKNELVQACIGLTQNDVGNALAKAIVHTGGFLNSEAVRVVFEEKHRLLISRNLYNAPQDISLSKLEANNTMSSSHLEGKTDVQEQLALNMKFGPATDTIRILFLAANPSDTSRLRLDQEYRTIDQALRRAKFRDKFQLDQYQAVRFTDLQDCLLRFQPHIVHFGGHGTEDGEIVLEGILGYGLPVPDGVLGSLFSILKDNIRCVVLNACYSERQASVIAEHIDCVIGMSRDLGDEASIGFSAAFYQALAYGRDIATAFRLGCTQVELEGSGVSDTPKLIAKRAKPNEIRFAV